MTEAVQPISHFCGMLIGTACAIILGTEVYHPLHWRYQSSGTPKVGRPLLWPNFRRGQNLF